MTTKLIALTLAVSMLGLGGVADARTGGGRHGGSHHVARSAGHVRHVSHLGRRPHRTHRAYAHRAHRGNNFAYGPHRSYRHARRYNHGYVYQPGYQSNYVNQGPASAYWQNYWSNLGSYNHVNWPSLGYTSYMNGHGFMPNTSATTGLSNSITVPAMVTLPRGAVS